MTDVVLDASAVLAYLQNERGGDLVQAVLRDSLLCSVNLAEVVKKLVELGATGDGATELLQSLPLRIRPLDHQLGLRAGFLNATTRSRGLSLGDCACLALAERERLPVLTADRAWIGLDIAVEIRLIR